MKRYRMKNINIEEFPPKTELCTIQAEILELIYKLKRSEYRGEQAEMNIQRLNVRIDQVAFVINTFTYTLQPKDSLLFS